MARAYTTPNAAKRIGVSYITLRRWLASGKVKVKAVGAGKHKLWVWTTKDIQRVRQELKRLWAGKDTQRLKKELNRFCADKDIQRLKKQLRRK